MDVQVIAMIGGIKMKGRLTTEHAASSYGQPVFVDASGQAYDWISITEISTATETARKAGQATSERKAAAARSNGRLGGRPRKQLT